MIDKKEAEVARMKTPLSVACAFPQRSKLPPHARCLFVCLFVGDGDEATA